MLSIKWSRQFARVVVVLLAGVLAGCATTIDSDPDTFDVPADAAKHLRAGENVALNNAYPSEMKVKIWADGNLRWMGDLKQYTDTAITMLSREMQKKSVAVDPKAAKTVTLRVYDVRASYGWTIGSVLTLEAQYGDDTKSTITTKNNSPADAWRAVDGALMFAVSQLLSDDEFLAYVNREITATTVSSNLTQEGSPSGAVAAATVTALGVTSEKEVSESIAPITVAVFPFARSGMVVTNDADHLLTEFAHQYVLETRQLQLSASYFKQDGSKIRGKSNYWSATNRPLESQIYSDGARIGADVVLMYSYSGRYASEDRFDVTVYLFDVKNRLTHQASGDQDSYKRVTESLFREITAIP
jgi:hypothetical protein